MDNIDFIYGEENFLKDIKGLWQGLNKHHLSISNYFDVEFRSYNFEQRVAKLRDKYQGGKVRVDIAASSGKPIGYIISGITNEKVGKIDSIFIKPDYRSRGIGGKLMELSRNWLDNENAINKVINVVVGNEEVFDFYAKFGFFPRVIWMKQRLVQQT